MKWYESILNGLKSINNQIENDTWDYLANDKPIDDLEIVYKGVKVNIPLELAEMNDFTQGTIKELIELVNDLYVER